MYSGHGVNSVSDLYLACAEINKLHDKSYLPAGMTEKQTECFNRSRNFYINDIIREIKGFEKRMIDCKKAHLSKEDYASTVLR